MARKTTQRARIRVRTSFEDLRRGDEAVVDLNVRVQGWLEAGLVEVVGGGEGEAGPGSFEPAAVPRKPRGAGDGVEAGREPGEGFGSGGYGTAPR